MHKQLLVKILFKNTILRGVFICFFILSSVISFSQVQDSTHQMAYKQYLKSYFSDSKDIAIAPFHWSKKEWIATGAVVGGTVLLMQYDKIIQEYAQSKQNEMGENITKYGLEPWGSGVYSISTMALFYGQGLIWKNKRSKKVALMGVKAYILSGFFVTFPKLLFNRHRPYHDQPSNPYIWEGPSLDLYKSFPSGHTTTIFAMAAVVASEYKETIWVPLIAYSLASLSGLSRIYDNKHWASDVFFAAAFGWSIGKLIHNSNHWNIQVSPVITNESASLHLNYRFK